MSPKSGGVGSAPNPGVLGRASLGSCLAIGYAMWAARRGVVLEEIAVEVQADFDTAAEYGLTDDQPGYRQVRCNVKVRSKASARGGARGHRGSESLQFLSGCLDPATGCAAEHRGYGVSDASESAAACAALRMGQGLPGL